VSQCHSEPKAKNLLFVRCRKNRCFARAQHDTEVICRIATQSLCGWAVTVFAPSTTWDGGFGLSCRGAACCAPTRFSFRIRRLMHCAYLG
jgi:hypothetical protein